MPWHVLGMEAVLAKNYPQVVSLTALHGTRVPLLERLLPSLLYVIMGVVIDGLAE
jgi:hypothetical protein